MGNEDFDEKKQDNQEKENTQIEQTDKDNKNIDNKSLEDALKESLEKLKDESDDDSLDDLMDKMQNLLDQVGDEYGVEPDKIKVMAFPKPKFNFISILATCLVILVFNFAFVVALSAVFDEWAFYEKKLNLIYFALFFAFIEIFFKLVSLPFFKIKSNNIMIFTIIKEIPFFITCILCGIWPVFIKIDSYFIYILICLITYAGRKFYTTYFMEKQMKKLMKKHSNRLIDKNKKK